MKFYKELLLDNLKIAFIKGVSSEKISSDILEIKIPMFLDCGELVDIKVKIKKDSFTIYNTLYRKVMESLTKEFEKENKVVKDIRKKYFDDKKIFKEIKEALLEKQQIEIDTLLMEKKIYLDNQIEDFDYEVLSSEVLSYAHAVSLYYNHVFHHILSNAKGERKKNIVEIALENYLEKIKELYNKNYIPITHEKYYSKNNEYYKAGDKILTMNNSKIHFMESLLDFEKLKENNEYEKAFLLANINGKNDLTADYIFNFDEKLKKLKIDYKIIEITNENPEIKIDKLDQELAE